MKRDPRPTDQQIADAIEIISICTPVRERQGGMWFSRNNNFADATFVDYGACRSFAVAAKALPYLAEEVSRLTAERDEAVKREKYAITWANRSVDSVKEADDAIIAGLRKALEEAADLLNFFVRPHKENFPPANHLWARCIEVETKARSALATKSVSDADAGGDDDEEACRDCGARPGDTRCCFYCKAD